jgi:hypothetical protein
MNSDWTMRRRAEGTEEEDTEEGAEEAEAEAEV